MAAKMLECFEQAKVLGGSLARTKLAMITRISSVAAGTLPDTPDNVKTMENGLAEVRKQLGK